MQQEWYDEIEAILHLTADGHMDSTQAHLYLLCEGFTDQEIKEIIDEEDN